MRKLCFAFLALGCVAAPLVRFELVAQTAPAAGSIDAVKSRVEELTGKVESIKQSLEGLKERGARMHETVGEKTRELKALAEKPEQLSDELKKLAIQFHSGQEADEAAAVDGIEKLASRDEAALALGRAAKDSKHESVRHKALSAAIRLGEAGYPSIAIAYESLASADRVFLAKELAKTKGDDKILFFALMAKNADEQLSKTLLDLELPPSQKLLQLASLAELRPTNELARRVVELGDKIDGEPGIIMLFAVAKSGEAEGAKAACEAAAKRKTAGLPILAVAFETKNKDVRSAIVRSAKSIGGEAAQVMIQTALADSDAELRIAAEEANK